MKKLALLLALALMLTFTCAALADSESGKIAVYYGAADTSVALAFTTVDETIEFIKKNDLLK